MSHMSQATQPINAGATFNYRGSSYRIDAFMCEQVRTPPAEPFLAKLFDEIEAEEDAKLAPGTRRIRLRFCLPSEATFVCGTGVCGCVAALDEIEITGMVGWTDEQLAEHHAEALSLGERSEFAVTIIRPTPTAQEL